MIKTTQKTSNQKSLLKQAVEEYKSTNKVDLAYVENYFKDAEKYLTSAGDSYGEMKTSTSASIYNQRKSEADDLRAKSFNISKYLDDNRSAIGEDNYKYLKSQVEGVKSAIGNAFYSFSNANDYYSRWESDDHYFKDAQGARNDRLKWYDEQKAKVAELENEYKTANSTRKKEITAEMDSINAEIRLYERGENGWTRKYLDDTYSITENEDFESGSANRNFKNIGREQLDYYDAMMDTSQWYWDADGNQYDAFGNKLDHSNVDERGILIHPNADQYKVTDRYGMWKNATEDDRYTATAMREQDAWNSWANAVLAGNDYHWDRLTEDEVKIYYYLLNTQGSDAASAYLDNMEVELAQRETSVNKQEWTENYDESGFLGKVFMNAASVPANVFGSALAFLDDSARQLRGEELNPYNGAHTFMHYSNTVRGLTAEDLDETRFKIPVIDFSLGDIYQVGMSRLDSALATGMFGGAGTFLLGTGAAANEAYRLYQRGASEEQITLGAFAAGAAETLFEYASFDKLVKMKDVKKLRQWVNSALIQGGIEASEEGFTEISNILTNAIIMRGESDWAELIEQNGGSKNGAFWDATMQTIQSMFGGFLGGVGAGITQGGKSYFANQAKVTNTGRTILDADGGYDAMQKIAYDVANKADGKTKDRITKMAKNVSGETATGKGLVGNAVASVKNTINANKAGRLYGAVQDANNKNNAAKNKADIVKSLSRNDIYSETADDIADALVAKYNGQDLTRAQEQLLKAVENDKDVQDAIRGIVANEKSTMGQRSQNIRKFNGEIYSGLAVKEIKENIVNSITEKEFTPTGEYTVSTDGKTTAMVTEDVDGKTIATDTGEVISIKGIKEISNGKMLLDIGDGKTINAKDVSYANENDALIYESIARLGDNINADTANKLISKYKGGNALVFARGMAQAYTYGFYGLDRSEMAKRTALTTELTADQRNLAYSLGEQYRSVKDANDKAKASEKLAQSGKTKSEKGVYYRDKNGNATNIETYLKESGIKLNDTQKTGIEAMRKMSKMMGVRFNVFETWVENGKSYYLDADGNVVEGNPNGFYDTKTGEIYIDLKAGNDYQGTMLFTVAHEVTHFMRQWSPEHFTKIAKIVFQHGGMKGNVSELVALKQARAKAKGKSISYDVAMEEVVADGMETILKDGKVVEFMADVKKQDYAAWEKLKGWFDNLAKFLRKMVWAYSGQSAQTVEGAKVAEFSQDLLNQIEKIFAEGAVEAGDSYRAAQEQFSTDSIRGNADGAVAQSEVTTALVETTDGEILKSERTEYEALPKQMMSLSDGSGKLLSFIEGLTPTKLKGLSGRTTNGYTGRDVRAYAMGISGFTQEQVKNVNEFMDAMSEFMDKAGVTYKFIGLQDVKDAKLHYTYNADGSIKSIVLSAMVKNGDYPVNFDLSSICKKRVAMSKLIDKLAKRGSLDSGTVKLTPANIFKINTELKNQGYETACLGCFVESKRYNSLEWAKTFCNKWNAAVKKVNSNATYFGYGDNTFSDDSFTLEQAVKIDEAATKYLTTTKVERMANALKKYKSREQAGLPLVEKLSDAAKKRLVKSDTISDELKDKYLNIDVTTLTMADVEFLLENEVLPGASLSNKQAVTEMVKSGEVYQHLLRPSDLLTDRGISKLEALPNFHGVLYGHYGSGTPKLMQSYTPYNSEIALLPANKNNEQTLAEYLYTIAGVRMQSFSDFQIQNIYDYLQMVADLAARKLPAHAYTKEISFAKLLGMTGIKVNLSVMFDIDPMVDKAHAGLTKLNKLIHRGEYAKVVLEDEQGKWVYNIGDYQTQKLFAEAFPDEAKRFLQSIGFGEAVKLQSSPGYSANCGIIGVGYSDLGIFAMLDDNRIRYIIPYHASSLPAEIKVATNIALGTDYTSYQNNMKIAGIVDKNGNAVNWSIKEAYKRLGSGQAVINELNEKVRTEGWVVTTKKAQTGHGTYGLYEDLQKTNDPRQTAGNFMDWCIGNGTLPLFYQFASHENYYKLLYDFNVYDCVTEEYAPQQAVTNTYPTMVDGQVQPGNVTDGGFDTEYFQGTIDKQMAFMDEYSRNLDEDLDALADNMENGTMFSMRDSVEETKDLLAFHNISEKLLWDALRQKGLVMPSLAVTNKGLNEFGEISLLFDKSVIDPALNKDNKLYGADAWTPMQTSLKMNAKFDTDKTVRAVNTMKNRIGSKYASELLNITPKQFKEAIIKADGNIYEAYAHDIGVQTAYAMEKGIISKIPTNKDGTVNKEMLQKQLDKTLDTDDGWRQYRRWLNNISDTVITSYDQATNEDILRHMKAQPSTAKTFKLSETGELIVPAKEYSFIKEMRRNKNRLSENAEEATKAVAAEFMEFAKKTGDTQQVVEAINAGFEGRYNIADIMNAFRNNGIEISSKQAGELQALYKKAVELPTQYFEAKPGGTVGLDKVNTAVVPKNTSVELRQALEEAGINVLEYDGTKESRVEAMNSVESLKFSVREDMTEAERYEELKNRQLFAVDSADTYEYKGRLDNIDSLPPKAKSKVEEQIYALADKLHILLKPLSNPEIKFEFQISKNNGLKKSIHNQLSYGGSYGDFSKALINLDRIIPRAVLVEAHTKDRYADTPRADDRFEGAYVLIGAFQDSENIIPVKIEIKKEKGETGNLYVVVAMTKIERTSVTGSEVPNSYEYDQPLPVTGSAYSLQQIISKINPQDADFLKYIPDGMLSEEQIIAKKNAIAEENAKNEKLRREAGKQTGSTIYIKDGHASNGEAVNFIDLILDGKKKGETRTHKSLTRKWVGIAKDGYVYGRVRFGEPYLISKDSPEYKDSFIEGTEYDLKSNEQKYYYPILETEDFRDDPKPIESNGNYGTYRYQDRDTDSVSNRSLLANAFEGLAQNDSERNKIQEYKEKVELINAEEQKLREINAQIKELSFAKGKRDTKKISSLRFDALQASNRINTYDKQLLRLEASKPLQDVLAREKRLAYKKAEQRGKEALKAYREAERKRDEQWHSEVKEKYQASKKKAIETREKREAREKLQKLVLDTAKWISYPAKTDVKCPDILKQPYADFLSGIDLSSKRLAEGGDPTKNDLRLANAMGSLATALDRIMTAQDPAQDSDKVLDTGYLDLPADFVQKLRDMTENIKAMMVEGDYVVNNMTAAEVRQLSQMIRTLNHAIKTMSNLYANLRFANIEELGFDTMEFMDALGEIEKTGGMKDFVQWDNALPYYAFKRFGKGGESVFEGLMDAQDKLAFLAKEIFAFQEKTWTGKEAKAWSEDTHTITLPNGNELTLTTADAMSIYCLSRREQGLQHLLGGGTRVMGLQKGSQKAKDSRSMLTIEDVSAIVSSLTDRQKQVAESIQEFMSTVCAEWGNEISMKRFLTRDFSEKFYFPIESNDENLPTKDPAAQQSDLFRLLNISATKPLTPGANNEVIIRNVFDVFTGHASDMARLNAYGMALLDYMKWLNYREKTVTDEGQINVKGVRKSMEKAYGNAAKSYVLNLVKDVNGRFSDGGDPNILMKWMRAAKTASVGNSIRVATLQITSYPRAALVLSPKSLTLGLSKLPQIEKAKKYCGIALWKSYGFYDTNISRSIEDQMKGVTDVKQKLIELSLKGAEWGDAITWGALWNACEYEVAKTTKNKVGSEEFNQEVGKKLREVVYRTQVVDSMLTRSQIMRSKSGTAQEAAAFMSEPTLSANILMDAGFEFTAEKRRTGSAKAAWNKTGKYIGRAVAVYAVGQLAAALLEGLWDAWRDEEDEEFSKKYLDEFVENLVLDIAPFNKIPIISDLFEAVLSLFGVGFYSSDKMTTTWVTQAVSAVDAWKDALSDESPVTTYGAFYKTTRAISSFFGVSGSGIMREAVALWNNTAGAYDPTLKILTYGRSDKKVGGLLLDAHIKGDNRQVESYRAEFEDEDAYQSAVRTAIKDRYDAGEIDSNTAEQYLVKFGGLEDDDAYWKVQEWEYEMETGEDFKKYNDFYTAVQTGKDLKNVIKRYSDNGVDAKTLASQITSYFKPLYKEMSNTERASIKGYLLNAYQLLGYDRTEKSKDIDKWIKD